MSPSSRALRPPRGRVRHVDARRATRGFIDPFCAPRNCVVISRPASCRRYSQRLRMSSLLRGHWLRDGIQRSKRRYC